jgi:ABC-type antimicrobial peptide transport system permease subunit
MSNGEKKRKTLRLKFGMMPPFAIMILFILTAIFAGYIAPYDPTELVSGKFNTSIFSREGVQNICLELICWGGDMLAA